MDADLLDVPFDHFQRYAAAATTISSLPRVQSVLEVGANRQLLLGRFLPEARVVYSDIEPQPGIAGFVIANATALPFPDLSFDAVVCLDVIEHMPVAARAAAVREMARVARRIVLVACPLDLPWVHQAEAAANAVWKSLFDEPYPWLEEHQQYGLVEPDLIEHELSNAGLVVQRRGHGSAEVWARLMAGHFAKEAVLELAPAVAAIDRIYNEFIFESDQGPNCYREVFAGTRLDSDAEIVSEHWSSRSAGGLKALSSLDRVAASFPSVVSRVVNAEREWSVTSQVLQDEREQKRNLGLQLHEAGLALEQAQHDGVAQMRRADAADKATRDALERLDYASQQWHSTVEALGNAREQAVAQMHRADRADDNTREANRKLEHAVAEWKATVSALEEMGAVRDSLDSQLRDIERALKDAVASGTEQLQRADEADRKTLQAFQERDDLRERLDARLRDIERALKDAVASGTEQLQRADEADRKTLQALQERDDLRERLHARVVDHVRDLEQLELQAGRISELDQQLAGAAANATRLLARVRGLERRQRVASWVGLAALILASVAGTTYLFIQSG